MPRSCGGGWPRKGFATRVAVADTLGCAWAVARFDAREICLVPRAGMRATLAPLPLAALRLAPEIVDALAQVGLKHIGDVIDRPRAPLAARFGIDFVRRIDQALGREDEPIRRVCRCRPLWRSAAFPNRSRSRRTCSAPSSISRASLTRCMERRGEGARLLQAALFRTDGKVHRIELGTGAPLRDPARMRRLFVDRLAALGDDCDPGFGFDMVRLSALVTERCDPVQTGFAAPDRDADLAHLIDRLGARFGLRRVTRLVPQDTHIPEFAVAAVPAHVPRQTFGPRA